MVPSILTTRLGLIRNFDTASRPKWSFGFQQVEPSEATTSCSYPKLSRCSASRSRHCRRMKSGPLRSSSTVIDALVVGVYENKELIFVAKVKNGFVPRIRDELFPALKALQISQYPFKNLPEKRASRWGESLTAEKMEACRWVKPRLICQVAFIEWTGAGHLRHCTFIAMRDDKNPLEVEK